jgi:hypothetical protein
VINSLLDTSLWEFQQHPRLILPKPDSWMTNSPNPAILPIIYIYLEFIYLIVKLQPNMEFIFDFLFLNPPFPAESY